MFPAPATRWCRVAAPAWGPKPGTGCCLDTGTQGDCSGIAGSGGSCSRPSASPELEKGIHRLTCTSFSPAHTWAAENIEGSAVHLHPLHDNNVSKFGWERSGFAALHP